VDALHAALDRFYGRVGAGTIGPEEANDVIQSLARLLVPINFTTNGAFRHDPALTIAQLPDLALSLQLKGLSRHDRGFAKMELLRGRNRVVATLRDATRRVERALR